MNKKLIAAAVAASVAPFAAQAQTTVYGRINNAIDLADTTADSDGTTDITGVASRFGVKYSGDIGGGMTALGRYEFSTTTDKEKASDTGAGGIEDVRIATVGIKGPFGTINIGNQWSAYFDTFGTLVSPTYSLGYYLYSSVGGGPFRTSNTIKYSNTFGGMYVEIDARLNESNEGSGKAEKIRGDGFGVGVSVPLGAVTLAVALDSEDGDADDDTDDVDRTGVAVKWSGPVSVTVGYQNMSQDKVVANPNDDVDRTTTFINASGKFSQQTSWLLSYAQADDGVSIGDKGTDMDGTLITDKADTFDDATQLTWGIYHSVGGGLKMYYEAASLEGSSSNWDGARHLLGMRVDF